MSHKQTPGELALYYIFLHFKNKLGAKYSDMLSRYQPRVDKN